ncbi:MAG: TolC family protein [Treponema sp.]|nr:TolC family protein [Treponema sp.]
MKPLSLLIVLAVLVPFCACPETGIGFAGAARMAVETSGELRSEYAARAMKEGAWLWGIRAYLPRLSISASEDDRLSVTGTDSFLKSYSLNVDQLLWDGGRLSLSRRMEKAELDLAGSRLKQMAQDVADSAVSGYRDVLRGRQVLEIREKARESLEEQLRIMQREFDLGMAREADLLEAEITVAQAGLEILSLSMDLEEAEQNLAEKLGLEKLPALSERIDTGRSPLLPDSAAVRSLAESRNIDLAGLRYSVARRQAELKAASLSWVPSLRLTGTVGLNGRSYPLSRYSWSAGIVVDFSSPWISGNLGATAGKDPPYDKNARLQQTLSPAPDPAAVFSVRSAELALAYERTRYETTLKDVLAAAERGVKKCSLLDRKRSLSLEALKLEGEKFRLAELRLSLGEITRVDLMEARLDYAKQESAVVEAAAVLLEAERELERLLDLGPGELSALAEINAKGNGGK